jgi:NTE family protein
MADFKPLILCLLFLASCATFEGPANTPVVHDSNPIGPLTTPEIGGDTAVALAFSGGGTRAAAFAYGVLRGLKDIPTKDGKNYLDQVVFVSGVSGGSVTAAYFGLRGTSGFADLRERFLLRDAEAELNTNVSLVNVVRGFEGGVNDASKLSGWLDRNVFNGATLGDVFQPGKPIIWLNASDLYNRTPFLFSPVTFAALCSDVRRYPLSLAVAASAAVPIVFVPIVLESYPTACTQPLPLWADRALANPNAGADVQAFAQALRRYRTDQVRYLKLADGGITDNFGLTGLVIARAAADKPYMPLTPDKAVRLRRVVFIIVDSGQRPSGTWSQTIEGPTGAALLGAVTDTAIDSAVRSGFNAFRLSVREWEEATRKWRCSLSGAEARRLGASRDWRCSNIRFEINEIAFNRFDSKIAAKLNAIPTRFKLETEEVDLLIRSGHDAVASQTTLKAF